MTLDVAEMAEFVKSMTSFVSKWDGNYILSSAVAFEIDLADVQKVKAEHDLEDTEAVISLILVNAQATRDTLARLARANEGQSGAAIAKQYPDYKVHEIGFVERYESRSGNDTWKAWDEDQCIIYLRQADKDLLTEAGIWDKLNDLLFGESYEAEDAFLHTVEDGDFRKPVQIEGDWKLTRELGSFTPDDEMIEPPENETNAIQWADELFEDESGFLVLDTETNDFKGSPVEIAVIDQDGKVLFDKRVKLPEGETMHANALRTHGISEGDLKDAPTFAEIADELTDVLSGQEVVIYNADFDTAALGRAYRKIGKVMPMMIPKCAMNVYAEYNGEWNENHGNYRWVKLAEAAAKEGITVEDAHSALGDCKMTLAVIKALAAKARSDKPASKTIPF